jgi:heme exporter protein D
MRNLDFSSWQAVSTTLLGLVVVTVMMVGIRLLVMETVQHRRNRENRQINERLRTLIAAYKTLGGSFTGDLAVDPTHLRDVLSQRALAASAGGGDTETGEDISASVSFDRSRRIRDAVEAALSDVILLGTEEQVRLAARAATDLAAGRPVHTDELVVSLRDFIRKVLDLEPVPTKLAIPKQGPTRPGGGGTGGGKGKGGTGGDDRADTKQDGKGAGVSGGSAVGAGMGVGGGLTQGEEGDEGLEAESSPWHG